MNLVYDRTAEDVERALALAKKAEAGTLTDVEKTEWLAGMKGCYNATDMNRVEAAVKSIAAELKAAGYPAAVEPVLKGASKLPSGFTEVEYIESSGTQYVDTGVVPNHNTAVMLDIDIVNADNWGPIFGSRDANVTNEFCMFAHNPTSVYQDGYGNVAHVNISVSSVLGRQTINKALNNTYINDELKNSFTAATFQGTYPMFLFQINSGGSAVAYKISGRIYRAVITKSSTIVRDFIPCKNPSGTVGLYDTVNGTFYGNSGTGVFTAGAEISALEDREWRESDIIRLSQWRQYLANVQALRDAYYTLAETGALPAPEDKLGYVGANNIEKILADIDLLLDGMKSIYRKAGTFSVGGNYVRQMIRSV